MVYLHWHLAQKFNILIQADSDLETCLSYISPKASTDDQKTSYVSYSMIEYTETLGYTPAFKYEVILLSSSFFPPPESWQQNFFTITDLTN